MKIRGTEEWDASMGELSEVGRFTYNYKDGAIIAAIIAQMDLKPVELLSDYEKLGILLGLKIPLHVKDYVLTTYTGVGFALIGREYHVFLEPVPVATYC